MSISFTPDQVLVIATALNWAALNESCENEGVTTFASFDDPFGDVSWIDFPQGENLSVVRALGRFEREFVTYKKGRGQGMAVVRKYHRLLISSLNDWLSVRKQTEDFVKAFPSAAKSSHKDALGTGTGWLDKALMLPPL